MQRNIYIFLSFSLVIHLVSLMVMGIGVGDRSARQHHEVKKNTSLTLISSVKSSSPLPAPVAPQKPSEQSSQRATAETSNNFELAESRKIRQTFFSGELDTPLEQINHIEIEPEYGFSDDAKGILKLILVIDETGKPQWVVTDETALDASTTSYIIEAFKQTLFSQPSINGKPVKAILRIELTIGEMLTSNPHQHKSSLIFNRTHPARQ
jgi:hypothetical protein